MPDARRARDARADEKYYDEEAYDDGSYEGDTDAADEYAEPRRRARAPARTRREEPPRREEASPTDIARAALEHIAGLTGKRTLGVTSLERSDDDWVVEVEVLEDSRIPSSGDILGLYRTRLGTDGTVMAFNRIRRYSRGRSDISEVA
ncbi:gas vesicle protein GvpO [Dactylosporangium sp. NPDC051484]|uniref:gas vesicle protein GvpO n=1 Tax=Dactylosporangium sp. NPDC051484 TaxID=3154942 RepID=UPI00344D009A